MFQYDSQICHLHECGALHVREAFASAFRATSHLILSMTTWRRDWYNLHFTNDENET